MWKRQQAESDDLGSMFRVTLDAIDRRASLWRWQVISATVAAFCVASLAVFCASARPLVGGALIVPLVGVFFVLDARVVRRWHARVLSGWTHGAFTLDSLRQGLRLYPRLPARTLESMLRTLPEGEGEAGRQERVERADSSDRKLVREIVRSSLGYASLSAMASACGAFALREWAWGGGGILVAVALRSLAGLIRLELPERLRVDAAPDGQD